jgi:putative ABC transport system substrate-binding protein
MSICLRRREFIAALGGAAATWPIATRAQQGERVRRVGVLYPFPGGGNPVFTRRMAALRQGLAQFGWIEGLNLRIDAYHGPQEQVDDRGAELVGSAPDVIVVYGVPATRAVQQRTRIIPIVFLAVGDPIANGIVKSVARPEGNATGFANLFASLGGKWVELLKDAAPQIFRIAIVWDTNYTAGYFAPSWIETATKAMAIERIPIPVHSFVEIALAVPAFAAQPNGGLLVMPMRPNLSIPICKLAVENKLPSIGSAREDAAKGALLSSGSNRNDLFRDAATYVDRILRGEKPSDLPVQFPTKFEMVVNRRTAKALGLEVPLSILVRADEVIE